MSDIQHIYKSGSDPVTAPPEAGHHFVNTTTGDIFFSNGTASVANWVKMGSGGALTFPILAPSGGVPTAPDYAFSESGDDTGMYSTGDGNISWACNGTLAMAVEQGGHLTIQGNFAADNFPPTGTANRFAGFNGSGSLYAQNAWQIETTTDGVNFYTVKNPNAFSGNFNVHAHNINLEPTQNSPDETWSLSFNQMQFDTNSSGFGMGTNGTAGRIQINSFVHNGTGNIGGISFIENNFGIGNGTDPIDVNGASYMYGFGSFNAGVNISGPLQGYGFQMSANAATTMANTEYIQGFYDACNLPIELPNYSSFNASPTIGSIANNNNYNGLNINPNIGSFTGNAGGNAIAISGNWGTSFGTGGWQGININATMSGINSATGLNITMDSVTVNPGAVSSLVIADLTISFQQPGDSNSYQVEYVDDATAGSETAALSGQLITVHMESGVSTADQIKAAIEANPTLAGALTVTVTGTGTNTQTSVGPINFTGGINPGNKKAAYLDGDVEITGALTFGGALSIGKLNAFSTLALVDTGGNPQSVHSLITQPTVAANEVRTSADMLGVNTAALISIGDNASVSTAFIGMAALGLPAVLSMGTGSTLDRCYGALFALSLDDAATGGTVDEVGLCKSLAVPNGVTTVNKLYGYLFDLPFGDPGTTTWGFYSRTTNHNYLGGDLLIGGTAGSDDVVTNSNVGLEIKSTTKAFVLSRMDTTARNAMTAIAGMVIFNTDTSAMEYYDGGAWV